ncbi:hypothetical protein EJ04DRAFT_508848 [Polyplosphaeria fusca]|uniref:DUF985 domain-containing protein n=1 Tax=Polyplosphaeria fusca TaxID=682080 RepID=A0A9P4R647_9PLEO|nr:hypothetical protein EJ04DRAFT_508848 [Polyplosphaeria fusca]
MVRFLQLIIPAVAAMAAASCKHERHSAQEVINKLNLTANVEKGWFVETFADPDRFNNRTYSTAIYYLLEGREGASYWHKVDAVEVWHHYAGAPLRLDLSYNNGTATRHRVLGDDIFKDQRPQVVIDKNEWQRAQSLGDWTLVGTTVAPGFTADGFELAAPDWQPNDGI